MWLAAAARSHPATSPAVPYRGDVPFRIVLHTTEGGTVAGALAAYRAHGGWPHFTADYATGEILQHYDTVVGARALRHPAGEVDTNAARAIQLELVGFAGSISPAALRWLGAHVVRPVAAAHDVQLAAPTFKDAAGAFGTAASTRMTAAAWLDFGGICGHQHVPANTHWDPGPIDPAHLIEGATAMTIPSWAVESWAKAVAAGQVVDGTQLDTVERYELVVFLDRLGAYDNPGGKLAAASTVAALEARVAALEDLPAGIDLTETTETVANELARRLTTP